MRKERIDLTSDNHLTSLYALDEVLDLHTNISAQYIGHSRAYVVEEALLRYPLEHTDKIPFVEPTVRYEGRPDLTASDYATAITVFDHAAKNQDPVKRTFVRAALELRKDKLVKIELERTHSEQKQALEASTREDIKLENLELARISLSTVGWGTLISLFSVNFNTLTEAILGTAVGVAFGVRHEVKKEIGELKSKQGKRQRASKRNLKR